MYELHELHKPGEAGDPLEDFIRLPKDLYGSKNCPQNEQIERALLSTSHPLSDDFSLKAYVVYQTDATLPAPVARFVLTIYPQDTTLYIGFFECVNEAPVARFVFDRIRSFALGEGFTSMVGPVNASFWIGYRLKVNAFDRAPYYGEPYNKSYYLQLFEENGFHIKERYLTNYYRRAPLLLKDAMQYRARLAKAQERTYTIRNITKESFDADMGAVHGLITELYSDFPVYKPVSRQAFFALFGDLMYILDYHLVKLAFLDGEPVGFLIGVPDYGSLLNRPLRALGKLRVLVKRLRSSKYVMLYIGVMPEHRGLGKALAQTAIKEVYLRQARACIALTKQERANSAYLPGMVETTSDYVLLESLLGGTDK